MIGKTSKTAKSPLSCHRAGECGCSTVRNPKECVYQPFLDGWEFTPDVGYGAERGEVFTPRITVDKMIVDGRILPKRAVYNYDYRGSKTTLRKYIGGRVFEPAVGTGNFTATILWHKLHMAHELTGYTGTKRSGYRKNAAQLRRYQTYTLVALGSIYFNDIDPGNLQVTKWRLLRDSEIGADANITYWVNHVHNALTTPPLKAALRTTIRTSVKAASRTWGVADRDRGVLDVLYEQHTGQPAPTWLRAAWKTVLDENAKLFNGLEDNDTLINGVPIPGRNAVTWTFWKFHNTNDSVTGDRLLVPLARQLAIGEIRALRSQIATIPLFEDTEAEPDLFGTAPDLLPSREDAPRLRTLTVELEQAEKRLEVLPPFRRGMSMEFPRLDSEQADAP